MRIAGHCEQMGATPLLLHIMHYYHNPKCSKSRAALEILEQQDVKPEIHLYLEERPSREEIVSLLKKLGMEPQDLVRSGEAEYTSLNLEKATNDELIDAMAQHSNLIERPIFVNGEKAVIGRPPEKVLEILEKHKF